LSRAKLGQRTADGRCALNCQRRQAIEVKTLGGNGAGDHVDMLEPRGYCVTVMKPTARLEVLRHFLGVRPMAAGAVLVDLEADRFHRLAQLNGIDDLAGSPP